MNLFSIAFCRRSGIIVLMAVFVFAGISAGQTKKRTAAKPVPKKATATKKAAPKKATSTRTAQNKRTAAKPAKKMTAAERRKEASRKKAEEARRQAALAEQRRRAEAARRARERALAFERGLQTETAANIARDNTQGEDLGIRQAAVNALGDRAGTIVVMEAKTGRVVTMVNQDWAIKKGYKPCSTVKLVTGVAGINENRITPDGAISGDSGRMDLDDALAYSNNPYFQRVGSGLGSDKLIYYAKQLGLGQPTGINAEGEYAGKLPYGNNNPRIYSHADDFEVTPLQLAVMVTTIANGGKRVTPQITRERTQRTSQQARLKGTASVPNQTLLGVIPGMIGAAEYGTARRGLDQTLGVAGKTGSCIGQGSWVGLFASVAPIEDPDYAVVVITRGQAARGRISAAIASQIYNALGNRIRRDPQRLLALQNFRNRPAQAREAMIAARAGDEEKDGDEDEELADEAVEAAPQRTNVAGASQQRPTETPRVTRTTQSAPVFKPVVIEYDRSNAASAPARPAAKPAAPAVKKTDSRPVNAPARKPASRPTAAAKTTPATAKPAPRKPVTTAKSSPAKKPAANSAKKPVATKKVPATKKPAANTKAPAKSNAKPAAKKPAAAPAKKASAKTPAKAKPTAKKPDPKAKPRTAAKEKPRPRIVRN
ncbi:MAG: hypothetical protein IPM21_03915 [Acidobacteria bacterium]|nr:hypothetical protein [Acidobacteriota bacterium]